jgi:hypothetical protein
LAPVGAKNLVLLFSIEPEQQRAIDTLFRLNLEMIFLSPFSLYFVGVDSTDVFNRRRPTFFPEKNNQRTTTIYSVFSNEGRVGNKQFSNYVIAEIK